MENGANEAQMIQRIVLSGSVMILKISGSGSMKIARFLNAVASGELSTAGEIKLKTLLKSGDELKVFSIRGTDKFRDFVQGAREYGIVYSVIERAPDENDQVTDYEIMVKAKDAAKINRVIEKYNIVSLDDGETAEVMEETAAEEVRDKKPSLEEVRYIMSQMLEGSQEQEVNPLQTPENDLHSGIYLEDEPELVRVPNAPLEERSSVIEEIKDIKAEMPDNTQMINPFILSQILSEEDISEEDKLIFLNYSDQIQDVMNSVVDLAGGENSNG